MTGPYGRFTGGNGGTGDGGRGSGDGSRGRGHGSGDVHDRDESGAGRSDGPRRDGERIPAAHGSYETGGTGEEEARPGEQSAERPADRPAVEGTSGERPTGEQPPAERQSAGEPSPGGPGGEQFDHRVLKSLLGAWALAACSAEETAAVEGHLSDCGTCAEEALRLRDAVGLLHPEDSLDLDPMLRSQVLRGCMVRRAPRIPVPDWASPYDAETSRLDALLRDMADAEWLAPVLLRWFDGSRQAERQTTVGGVIAHLLAADGVVATALGLPDPLDTLDADAARSIAQTGSSQTGSARPGSARPGSAQAGSAHAGRAERPPADGDLKGPTSAHGASAARRGARRAPGAPHKPPTPHARHVPHAPAARTEEYWRSGRDVLRSPAAREPWREQGRAMVRTVSFAGSGVAGLDVDYGDFTLPVRDAMLDRAFECWMHAEDIAEAIDYPYTAPQGEHMHHMVDLAARLLPGTIAWRRRTGRSGAPHRLTTAGAPGRALHLEVEGDGGGDWYIPLDSPAAAVRPEDAVAHVALDRYEFCQLVAGHVQPLEAAAGQDGDREAVRDVLFAAASLSRM